VAELAAMLRKSPDTVKKDIRKLYPGVMVSGRRTYLNTEQVAALVARRKRLDASSRGVGSKRASAPCAGSTTLTKRVL
jgi:hypothetical protein